jgi:hypothetical protein
VVFIVFSFVVRDGGRAYNAEGSRQGAIPLVDEKLSCFKGPLRALDDAKVGFRSGTECLKRLLVCVAFMSHEGIS